MFENPDYPGIPRFEFRRIGPGFFEVLGLPFQAIPLSHGELPVLGFRIGAMAYLTDFNRIEPREIESLQDLDFLVIDALHRKPHHSHLHLDAAIALGREIGASKVFFTHISHRMGLFEEVQSELPAGFSCLCDAEVLEIEK